MKSLSVNRAVKFNFDWLLLYSLTLKKQKCCWIIKSKICKRTDSKNSLKFDFQFSHSNLCTNFGTDQKWTYSRLHTSSGISKILLIFFSFQNIKFIKQLLLMKFLFTVVWITLITKIGVKWQFACINLGRDTKTTKGQFGIVAKVT